LTLDNLTLNVEETVIPMHGISKEINLVHLTDIHLTEADDREENKILDLKEDRRKCFERPDKIPVKDVLYKFLQYSDEINADCIVFTGDIIDFPSLANLELLVSFTERYGL
jgi:predicted MPP superfamily phosphohydrolase